MSSDIGGDYSEAERGACGPTASIIHNVRYTIRRIPAALDLVLRQRASAAGNSLNDLVLEVLANGIGLVGTGRRRRDLSDLAGSWIPEKAFDAALAAQDQADEILCLVRSRSE